MMNTLETGKDEVVKHQQTRNGDQVEYVTWWEASYKDILFNFTGIVVGIFIRTYV